VTQVRLLVPWHQVVLDSVGEDWIRRTSSIFGTSTDGHVVQIVSTVRSGRKTRQWRLELGQNRYTIAPYIYRLTVRLPAPTPICTLHQLLMRMLGSGGGEGPASA
jgi:hypothetical protein